MPSLNNNHGYITENILEQICFDIFGSDFVMKSPKLLEISGEKELTDILVLVDDISIIIQSKSIDIDISDLNQVKFNRIKKKYDKAKQQLNTTLNAQKRNTQVNITTSFDLQFNLNWDSIKQKIGIVTLNVPDKQYQDPEFRFQFPYLIEKHNNIIVHTFILQDLMQLSREISTPGDFIDYLYVREKCFNSGKLTIGNELDFLALYKTQYPIIEELLSDSATNIILTPGSWEYYINEKTEVINKRDDKLKNSLLIDRMIKVLRDAISYGTTHYKNPKEESISRYLKIIGLLGKLAKIERAYIGDKIIEKLKKTKTEKFGYYIHKKKQSDYAYLFLVVNDDDRKNRRDFLIYLCQQACHHVQCSNIVGFALPSLQQEKFCIDAVYMNAKETKEKTKPESDFTLFKKPTQYSVDEWKY